MTPSYICAECHQATRFGKGDFWRTPKPGTYEFICAECTKHIIENAEAEE